jgi:hypothetical protein
MINKNDLWELSKISDQILQIIDYKEFEEMPRGDLQGVIEAQINMAYYLGIERGQNEK